MDIVWVLSNWKEELKSSDAEAEQILGCGATEVLG